MKMKVLLLILLVTFVSACSDEKEVPAVDKVPEPVSNINLKPTAKTIQIDPETLSLTAVEKAYLDKLRKSGGLKSACRIREDLYFPDSSGAIIGFHYHLIKNFCDSLDLKHTVRLSKFKEYFAINGAIPPEVKIDTELKYVPDLIKEVDVITETITILPWREKLLRFVPILLNKQLVVTKKGEEISTIAQLTNKTIVVSRNTSYYSRLKEIEKELGRKLKFIFIDDEAEIRRLIVTNVNYATVIDSNRLIREMNIYKNISACFPITEMENLGWAVHPDNKLLANILTKYIQRMRDTDKLDLLWKRCFKINLLEYLKLLN